MEALAMADDNSPASDLPFLRCGLIVVAVGALVAAIWLLSEVLLLAFGAVLVAVTLRVLAAPFSALLDRHPAGPVGLAALRNRQL
jgi:hypothetical protein